MSSSGLGTEALTGSLPVAAMTRRQAEARQLSRRLMDTTATPGPHDFRMAVDMIVGRLRKLVLQQAWERWKPTLTPGQVAQKIIERQRIRLRRSASLDLEDTRLPREFRMGGRHHTGHNDIDNDAAISPSSCVSPSGNFHDGQGGARGRTRSCTPTSNRKAPRKFDGLVDDGYRSSRLSPAAKAQSNTNIIARDTARSKGSLRSSKPQHEAIGAASRQWGSEGGSNPQSSKKDGDQSARSSISTIQQCFKEERASFIRDLQVLHRQLEAKDRDSARREKESRAAVVRAEVEAHTAREQADVFHQKMEEVAAAKAAAEATIQALTESVTKQTTEAESLRTRLRHCERQHNELMKLDRHQLKVVSEEASAERRRLEFSVQTARKALSDGRREWATEKDVFLAAVRDAGHRAELAAGEATEAKAHAVLLEERLQQTLEREAALNARLEAQQDSARNDERRVARAEADAARAQAAAAAQEKSFLEHAKSLEEQASRAEIMRVGEKINREEMQTKLEKAKDDASADSSKVQGELSSANLKAAFLQQELSSARAETEVLGRKVAAADVLIDSARSSTKEFDTRLKEARRENLRLVAEAARVGPMGREEEERELLEEKWRRREGIIHLPLHGERSQKRGERAEAEVFGEAGFADVMGEVEDLQATVMRLLLEKEALLRQQPLINGFDDNVGEGSVMQLENGEDAVGTTRIRGNGRPAAPFPRKIGGLCGVYGAGDGASFGVRSGGRGTKSRQFEARRHTFSFQRKIPNHYGGRCTDDARTVADESTDEGKRISGVDQNLPAEIGESGRGGQGEPGGNHAGAVDRDRKFDDKRERPQNSNQLFRRRCPGLTEEAYTVIAKRPAKEGEIYSDAEENIGECPRPDESLEFRRGHRNCYRHWRFGVDYLPNTDDEKFLAPRGGPAPVPSPWTPRYLGTSWGRPAREPSATAALLRTSIEQERRQRRWEHDTLIAVLRDEDVVPDQDFPPNDQGHLRCPSPSGDASIRAAEGDRDTNGNSAVDTGDRPVMQPKAGENDSSPKRLITPLTSEAWIEVLETLRRLLQLRQPAACIDEKRRQLSKVIDVSVERVDDIRLGKSPCADAAVQASLYPLVADSDALPDNGTNDDTDERSDNDVDNGRFSSCFNASRCGRAHASLRKGGGRDGGRNSNVDEAASRAQISNQKIQEGGGSGGDANPSSSTGLSSVIASALRELLSSTPGVSAERVRDAPLPDLIEALHREWETLLEALAVMQEEIDRSHLGADSTSAQVVAVADAAALSINDGNLSGSTRLVTSVVSDERLTLPPLPPDARYRAGHATDPEAPEAEESGWSEISATKRRIAELEAALDDEKQRVTSVKTAAGAETEEAVRRLEKTERERSDATNRLAAALQDLATERTESAARLTALKADMRAMTTSLTAAKDTATAAKDEAAASKRTLDHLQCETERLKTAADSVRWRAEFAEERSQKLANAIEEGEAFLAGGVKRAREKGRKEGRREAGQRVNALELSLEKLAETGSAAERISKEQLEVTRELSIERDSLLEENERVTARLDQLTSALREQREEKAHLTNQVLDRERGLEAARAQRDLERSKVAMLHSEVEKAQSVCREMTDRLVELQATQEELRATREKLAVTLQEVQSLRRSKAHYGAGWEEARRLKDCLDSAKRLDGDMSGKAEAAETRAECESRRARHLEARVHALQNQLDQVPNDLLVAHAEKRVLQGALEKAAQQAADAKASAEAEIRRRDADIRNFASSAAVQQERCGQRLREQALTIHQLTLQHFSTEAQVDARVGSVAGEAGTEPAPGATMVTWNSTATGRGGKLSSDRIVDGDIITSAGRNVGAASATSVALRPLPRRGYLDTEEHCSDARRRFGCGSVSVAPGEGVIHGNARRIPSSSSMPISVIFDTRTERCFDMCHSRRSPNASESGRERGRGGWEGHSLDSDFPAVRFGTPPGAAENLDIEGYLRHREEGENTVATHSSRQAHRGSPLSSHGP